MPELDYDDREIVPVSADDAPARLAAMRKPELVPYATRSDDGTIRIGCGYVDGAPDANRLN